MLSLTLDNNCLVDIEERRCDFEALLKLVSLWRKGAIELCISAISAAELTKEGQVAPRVENFWTRISNVGLTGIPVLSTIFYWGIGYWGSTGVYGTPEMFALEKEIHEILFLSIEYKYDDFCLKRNVEKIQGQLEQKWRNA